MRNASRFPIRFQLRLLPFAFAALFAAAPAAAADEPAEPIFAVVDVDLDAGGKVVAIEPADALASEMAEFLRAQVSTWEFEPATLRGQPVPTRTSVMVRLEPTGERTGRQVEVRIVDAATGPRYRTNPAPRYPQAAFERRDTGAVLLRVDFDRDGRVTDAAVERSVGRKSFETAALNAVRKWTFQPERVGDIGVAARVLVPIRFCIQMRPCQALPEPTPGDDANGPRLVGDPVARIRSRGPAG